MLPPPYDAAHAPNSGSWISHGACLLSSIRTVPAAAAAQFESLGRLLSKHRGLTRVSVAALSITVVVALSTQPALQAGRMAVAAISVASARESILPQSIGVGVTSDTVLAITFDAAMDPASVESTLRLTPAQPVELHWNGKGTRLEISPARLWRTDQRYLVAIGPEARGVGGSTVGHVQNYSFTTQTAPVATEFGVQFSGASGRGADAAVSVPALVDAPTALAFSPSVRNHALPLTATADAVSAGTTIRVGFSRPMDAADVANRFTISPAVEGSLDWAGGHNVVFTPTGRLTPGARYTVSLVGAHDAAGNRLGGKTNFSFTVLPGAQLMTTRPGLGEVDVETGSLDMWFSQPMDSAAVDAALSIVDLTAGVVLGGDTNWSPDGTQLTFAPSEVFAAGHVIEVRLGEGSADADGNQVTHTWSFTTKPPPPPEPVRATSTIRVLPPPAPSSSLEGYALNQINAARAAYGFAPLVLDPAISAVAHAHAYDQALNGYFSHVSLDGRTRVDRLIAGGVSFGYSGENQCYLWGSSLTGTLDWCHAAFMAEPYPGEWNHIANVLDPRFTRVGVGIAQVGATVIVTWDFAD